MRPGGAGTFSAAAATDALRFFALALLVVTEVTAARTTAGARKKQDVHKRPLPPPPPPQLQCKRSPEDRQREIRSATAADCGRSPVEKLLRLDKLQLDVNHTSHGDYASLLVSYNASAVLPDGISLELKLEKSILGMPFRLPCLPSKKHPTVLVGSCTYKDLCSVLSSTKCHEPPNAHASPCTCSKITRSPKSRGRLRTLMFSLPSELVTAYMNLSNGDYTLKMEFVHVKTMRVLGCVEAKWTLAARRQSAPSTSGGSDKRRRP